MILLIHRDKGGLKMKKLIATALITLTLVSTLALTTQTNENEQLSQITTTQQGNRKIDTTKWVDGTSQTIIREGKSKIITMWNTSDGNYWHATTDIKTGAFDQDGEITMQMIFYMNQYDELINVKTI